MTSIWVTEPTLYLAEATQAIGEAEAGRLSADDAVVLMSILLRMCRVLSRRRSISSPAEVGAFLNCVLRHVAGLFAQAADAAAAKAAGDGESHAAPLADALADGGRLLQRVLSPERELYLYACVDYEEPEEAVDEDGAPSAIATDAASGDGWTPPLFRTLLNSFAVGGGFGSLARAVGTADALPLGTCATVLLVAAELREYLHPRFAARACAALAAAASATLSTASDGALGGEGVDRPLLESLLGSLRMLHAPTDDGVIGGSGTGPASGTAEDFAQANASGRAELQGILDEWIKVRLNLALLHLRSQQVLSLLALLVQKYKH